MPKEINLLPRKSTGFLDQERTIIAARAIAIFSVLLVVSSFVGVFLLGKTYSLADVSAQQDAIQSRLAQYKGKIQKQLVLVSQTNHIESILKTRSLLEPKIESLLSLIPSSITVTSLIMTPKTVNLSVSSPSLSALQTFLDSLTGMVEKKTFFQKLTINNIVVDGITGNYTVSILGDLL